MATSIDRIGAYVAVTGQDNRYTRANWPLAYDKRSVASDECGVTNTNASNIGDSICGSRFIDTDPDANISRPLAGLGWGWQFTHWWIPSICWSLHNSIR
ncbi:MAG: hypothetical protein NVSMB42_07600 [Herpetosiphon sp.]